MTGVSVNRLTAGVFIVLLVTTVAVLAPWISPDDPFHMSLKDRLQPPSWAHPLGLDENGGDVLSRLIYGARVSLTVAWTVALTAGIIGLLLGSWAGYRGGLADLVIMRVVDMLHAFPGFLLALALVAMLGPSLQNLIFALLITGWTGFARLVRAEVSHLKTREHVMSANAIGAGPWRTLVVHVWPNLAGLVLVQSTFAMAGTIVTESSLSFLGLGVSPSTPTWGALLNSGRRVLSEAPHVALAPGVAIAVLVLGFNLLGDGLRDKLDPRRGRNIV